MKFSEREGLVPPRPIQHDGMDERLRNGLWNHFRTGRLKEVFENFYINEVTDYAISQFYTKLILEHQGKRIESISKFCSDLQSFIDKLLKNGSYIEILDFLEFYALHFNKKEIFTSLNSVLQKELSPFRFVGGILTRIIDETEVREIEKTLSLTSENGFEGARSHIEKALKILGNKEHPDYANVAKESISAVESLCKKLTGKPNAELGTALTELSKLVPLHGALISGYKSIYGYTSDADGIRHGMMDQSTVEQEDAIYMLVSCSAFINYLIAKSERAGLISK